MPTPIAAWAAIMPTPIAAWAAIMPTPIAAWAPPSPAIAVIPADRSCGLDRSPVGHTREG